MNLTTEQRELAGMVLEHIEAHPETHDQFSWIVTDWKEWAGDSLPSMAELQSCGTTACVAGWTVLLGAPAEVRVQHQRDNADGGVWSDFYRWVPDRATELLGITTAEADYLFDSTRSRAQVISHLMELRDGNHFRD